MLLAAQPERRAAQEEAGDTLGKKKRFWGWSGYGRGLGLL